MNPITYPARPMNGGDFTLAPAKPGRWFYEPKYNGWRALVHAPTGAMFNRHGGRLTIAAEFAGALDGLRHLDTSVEWFDCEALSRRHGIGRGCLIVLDIIPREADRFEHSTRRLILADLLEEPESLTPGGNFPLLCIPPLVYGTRDTWRDLMAINEHLGLARKENWFYEGLVAKRADSHYPIQLTSPNIETPDWIKHRFMA